MRRSAATPADDRRTLESDDPPPAPLEPRGGPRAFGLARPGPWVRALLCWLLVGLALSYYVEANYPSERGFRYSLTRQLLTTLVHVPFTPIVFRLAPMGAYWARFRFGMLLFSSAGLLMVVAVHVALRRLLLLAMGDVRLVADESWIDGVRLLGAWYLTLYALLASIGWVTFRSAELRRAAALQSHSDRRLAEARLQALGHQLSPHFLFNTLNGVRACSDATGQRMVDALSRILRAQLSSDTALVPLEEELDLALEYLAIQEIRFGSRLRVEHSLDPGLDLEASVPFMSLQPIYENAVKFGVESCQGECEIRTSVEPTDGGLCLQVRATTCEEAQRSKNSGFGIGLGNVRERLEILFPGSSAEQSTQGTMHVTTLNLVYDGDRRDG